MLLGLCAAHGHHDCETFVLDYVPTDIGTTTDDLTEENLGNAACSLPHLRCLLSELCQPEAWPFVRSSFDENATSSTLGLQDWKRRASDLVKAAQPLVDFQIFRVNSCEIITDL